MDVSEINTRLDVVEAFVLDRSLRADISFMLRGMPDAVRLAKKLESQKIELSELALLYSFSRKLHPIADRLRRYNGKYQSLFLQR